MAKASLRIASLSSLLAAGVLLGCAGAASAQALTAPGHPAALTPAQAQSTLHGKGGASDPLEPLNRRVFAFNKVLDRVIIRPAATFWHHAAPRPLRVGISNFLQNLGEPVVMVNDLLQGRPAAAAAAATRFAANSTIGVGGVVDITGMTGLPHHDNGFGLTLGRWGVSPGPYLYLPVLGPLTVRDGIGLAGDVAASPLTYIRFSHDTQLMTSLGGAAGLETRAKADSDLKSLQAMSTDEYAAMRSFYLQNRQSQVTGGEIDLNSLPDFDDPDADFAPPPAAPPTADTPPPAEPAPEAPAEPAPEPAAAAAPSA
jgi:phospholipid-binding lipoprotein MlaA